MQRITDPFGKVGSSAARLFESAAAAAASPNVSSAWRRVLTRESEFDMVRLLYYLFQRAPRSFHGLAKRVARHARDHRLYQPSQPGWDVSRKGNGAAFDVQTAGPRSEQPIGIQSPQKTIAYIRRERLAIFHF